MRVREREKESESESERARAFTMHRWKRSAWRGPKRWPCVLVMMIDDDYDDDD